MSSIESSPRWLTELDLARLLKLTQGHPPPLLAELLDAADVVAPTEVAPDVVTMHSRLRVSEAGAQHERVEAHLEQLDEVLTGQTILAAGLVERVAHLLLADAVLLAQTLLLAETDGEVAVLLALGAAVLTRSVGTLLEVLGRLGGECDAEGARQTHLAAVLGLRSHEVFLSLRGRDCRASRTYRLSSPCPDCTPGHAGRSVKKRGDARKLRFEPLDLIRERLRRWSTRRG